LLLQGRLDVYRAFIKAQRRVAAESARGRGGIQGGCGPNGAAGSAGIEDSAAASGFRQGCPHLAIPELPVMQAPVNKRDRNPDRR